MNKINKIINVFLILKKYENNNYDVWAEHEYLVIWFDTSTLFDFDKKYISEQHCYIDKDFIKIFL